MKDDRLKGGIQKLLGEGLIALSPYSCCTVLALVVRAIGLSLVGLVELGAFLKAYLSMIHTSPRQ